jgi:hypothetical protein
MSKPFLREDTWERMIRAVQLVEERLVRCAGALTVHHIRFSVTGGIAVARWVRTKEPEAERNTPNVDLLINRLDLGPATDQLRTAGFVTVEGQWFPTLVDGPHGRVHSGVRLLFENERVNPTDAEPTPSLHESVRLDGVPVVAFEPLVRMKLVAYRTIDRVHLGDLIGVGLIDNSWPDRFPPELAERLRAILADPDG